MSNRIVAFAGVGSLALVLASCGGGGSSGSTALPGGTTQSTQKLGVTFRGASLPFLAGRNTASSTRPQSVAGTAVSVTYNGAVVATGTLDSNGFAELQFTSAVPAGASVTVTAGTAPNAVTVTVVLASAIPATSADIVYQPANGSTPAKIIVTTAADQNNDGKVDANDPNQEVESENSADGTPDDVNSTDNNVLPANLPIVISTCNGKTITVAPAAGQPPLALKFEEKVHDSDSAANFQYNANPFTTALTFPVSSAAARVDIEVDNATTMKKIVTIEAPITAFSGAVTGSPTASPSSCPTLSPTMAPSPQPTSPS